MTETLTMTAPDVLPAEAPARPRGVRRVLYESAYALSAFPIALCAFIVVVVDISLGVALAIFIGGVLLISVGVMVARGFARFERIRMRGMLGRTAPTPSYIWAPAGSGFWRRSLTPLRDPQSWLEVVWAIVGLVTGTLAFAVALVWWAATLTGLTYWFWQLWIPESGDEEGLASLLGLGDGRTAESLANLVVGLLFLVTLPWAVRLVAAVHASLASVLLCSRAELQTEVARVQDSRDAARLAEAESLRRLERDIHDGPQQRLVRLSMDGGVVVHSRRGVVRAKHVIVAAPPPLVLGIEWFPKLPAKRLQLLRHLDMGQLMKCDAIYEKPFWRDAGLNGFGINDSGAARAVFDNSPKTGEPGVLLAFVGGATWRQYGVLPEADRKRAVLEGFAAMFGDEALHPIGYVEHDWTKEQWTTGGPVANYAPGTMLQFGSSIRKPFGRVHWAGTETSTFWTGYMDGAVRAGQRAAVEVSER